MPFRKHPILSSIAAVGITAATVYVNTPNKYQYPVLKVVDGDTVQIEAPFLPVEFKQRLLVRIEGIDTPEKAPLAKCDLEAQKSDKAKLFVEQEMSKAKEIKVVFKGWDKYGGRVLGDFLIDGKYLSQMMIDKGHAIVYHGEKKSKDWCSR